MTAARAKKPGKVLLTFTTEAAGKATVKLTISKAVAKAAGLGSKRTVGTLTKKVGTGKQKIKVTITKAVWKKLRKFRAFKVKVIVTQKATDGRTTSGRTSVRLP